MRDRGAGEEGGLEGRRDGKEWCTGRLVSKWEGRRGGWWDFEMGI